MTQAVASEPSEIAAEPALGQGAAQGPGHDAERVLSVVFRAGAERYLIPAVDVFKVADPAGIDPIPRLPQQILGITQHRGRVVTVFDLIALLFGEPTPERAGARRLIILDRGVRNAALLVDAIEEIAPIRLTGARQGPAAALLVVQHRGRPAHGLKTDVLAQQMLSLAGT